MSEMNSPLQSRTTPSSHVSFHHPTSHSTIAHGFKKKLNPTLRLRTQRTPARAVIPKHIPPHFVPTEAQIQQAAAYLATFDSSATPEPEDQYYFSPSLLPSPSLTHTPKVMTKYANSPLTNSIPTTPVSPPQAEPVKPTRASSTSSPLPSAAIPILPPGTSRSSAASTTPNPSPRASLILEKLDEVPEAEGEMVIPISPSTDDLEEEFGVGKGCTGCGTDPIESFVALIPCDHLLCPPCLNSLINACAHAPPRPLTCYACSTPVKSFGPAFELASGDESLVKALAEAKLRGEAGRSPRRAIKEVVEKAQEGGSKSTSSGDSTATPSTSSHYRKLPLEQTTPTKGTKRTTLNAAPLDGSSIGGSPVVVGRDDWESPQAARNLQPPPHLQSTGPRPHTTISETYFSPFSASGSPTNYRSYKPPHQRQREAVHKEERRSNPLSEESPAASGRVAGAGWPGGGREGKSFKSPVPPEVLKDLREPIAWPIVRLDNIPWDVSVAEVEAWLPPGTLAPMENCVLAVHLLCNRSDGRTLNQCYLEACTPASAREILRVCDGKKLRHRPVHVTLSDQGELMNTIFPSWEKGFTGLDANPGKLAGPLLLHTELAGLVHLCKLSAPHAGKVKERPYFNIVTIIQKYPWHQLEVYNSKQIVRLYNTCYAAVEIMASMKHQVPEWQEIMSIFIDAVIACPVFRPAQKSKITKMSGLRHPRFPNLSPASSRDFGEQRSSKAFSFEPHLGDAFVTVGLGLPRGETEDDSPPPSQILDLAESRRTSVDYSYSAASRPRRPSVSFVERPFVPAAPLAPFVLPKVTPVPKLFKAMSTPNLMHDSDDGSPKKRKRKTAASIAKSLGLDAAIVLAVAEQLGVHTHA